MLQQCSQRVLKKIFFSVSCRYTGLLHYISSSQVFPLEVLRSPRKRRLNIVWVPLIWKCDTNTSVWWARAAVRSAFDMKTSKIYEGVRSCHKYFQKNSPLNRIHFGDLASRKHLLSPQIKIRRSEKVRVRPGFCLSNYFPSFGKAAANPFTSWELRPPSVYRCSN